MKNKVLIGFLALLSVAEIYSQTDTAFIIGSYSHVTPWPNTGAPAYFPPEDALFSISREQEWGFNTILKYVRQPIADDNIFYSGTQWPNSMSSNMNTLKAFTNVIAINPYSAERLLDPTFSGTNVTVRNFDYIYFYSGAYYSKWDAARDVILVGELGLKHDIGTLVNISGKNYWSSWNEQGATGLMIKGPNYRQETRYRSSAFPTIWDKDIVKYKAMFNMFLEESVPPEQWADPVCEIKVVKKYYFANDPNHQVYSESPDSRILKVVDFWDKDKRTLEYNFSEYCPNVGTAMQPIEAGCNGKILIDVEFQLLTLDNTYTILMDNVEVFDADIWEKRLSTDQLKIQAKSQMRGYLEKFRLANQQFYDHHLKYFYSVDEPHSVDAYIPLGFVQGVLKELNDSLPGGAPQLWTHFYPEWSGYRDGANVIKPFVQTVKPKPFHFYYQPYRYAQTTATSIWAFNNIFYWVHRAIDTAKFWVTIDVLDIPVAPYMWRRPDPEELNAAVMLSLAHGAKGIFFENFYSYGTTGGLLLDTTTISPAGIKVKDSIIPRLKGKLGKTLLGLKYFGKELCLKQVVQENCPDYTQTTHEYLRILIPSSRSAEKYDITATLLRDDLDPFSKYFLVVNCITDEDKLIGLNITNPFGALRNLRLKSIEGGFDNTYLNPININYDFPKGEGYLFNLTPIVHSGGTLAVNDTITSNISLGDNLTISNGVNLVISNSVYTLKDTVTLQGTAMITGSGYVNIESAGRININSFSRGLFKTVAGANPKLFWYFPPGFSSVEKFKIYRQLESNSLELIAQVDGETFEYVDGDVSVFVGQTPPNESYVDYYVEAVGLIDEESQSTISSNTVRYRMDRDMQKQISGDENKVKEYELSNNYPNPFNPTTRIKYAIPQAGHVTIKVFDILGNEVSTLVNEMKDEGRYEVIFDAATLSSGVYFCELTSGKFISRKKMILLR